MPPREGGKTRDKYARPSVATQYSTRPRIADCIISPTGRLPSCRLNFQPEHHAEMRLHGNAVITRNEDPTTAGLFDDGIVGNFHCEMNGDICDHPAFTVVDSICRMEVSVRIGGRQGRREGCKWKDGAKRAWSFPQSALDVTVHATRRCFTPAAAGDLGAVIILKLGPSSCC